MVDVTQADRDALERLDDALVFLMEGERQIVLDALVVHREAGFEAGRRAGLEEAAGKCPARHSMHGCPMSAKLGDGHE